MFVKFNTAAGDEIRINMNRIESYGTITEVFYENAEKYVGLTYLIPVGMEETQQPYIVKETPEEIDQVLKIHHFIA